MAGAADLRLPGRTADGRGATERRRLLRLQANPANAFFYLFTAVHGLHVLGGLVAWGTRIGAGVARRPGGAIRLSVELCAIYWHYLLAGLGGAVCSAGVDD